MKWVWVHSMRFQRRGADVFSEAQASYKMWQRYLAHCDSLHVVGRGAETDQEMLSKYLKSCSGPRVSFSLLEGINTPQEMWANTSKVKSTLESIISDADGVIARLPSEHGLAAVSVARKLGKPLAVELVGCARDALWFHGDIRGKFYAPLMSMRVRSAVATAPFVLYVTKEFLQQRYPAGQVLGRASNVEISGSIASVSGVDVSAPQSGSAYEKSEPQSELQIGLIGAFQNEYKGHRTALRALKMVLEQGVSAKLRLIGVGSTERWQAQARELAVEDHVGFEGVLSSGDAVINWLRSLDIYIQPSLTEGLPRALIEAMSTGRPALASRVGGIPELLPDKCLHAAGDWRQLGHMLLRAARDPDWRRSEGIANRLKSMEYASDVLDQRRNAFWASFATYCAEHAGNARRCA